MPLAHPLYQNPPLLLDLAGFDARVRP